MSHSREDESLHACLRTRSAVTVRQEADHQSDKKMNMTSTIKIAPNYSLLDFISPTQSPVRLRNAKTSPGFFNGVNKIINTYINLYEFLIHSNVKNQQKTVRYNEIAESEMLDTDLDNIDDVQAFRIGFARKLCLSVPLTIYHASLAFRDAEGKFLIIGRQNGQFLKSNPNSASPSFTWWALSHLNLKTIYNFTDTHMGNEKKYDFFPGSLFNAEMINITLTGAEIKQLVKTVNSNVCSHRYDVVHSNCYSSVFYGLAETVKIIAARVSQDEEHMNENNKALQSVFTLICSALQDNYHLGLGGIDNTVVSEKLIDAIKILEDRKLLEFISQEQEVEQERWFRIS